MKREKYIKYKREKKHKQGEQKKRGIEKII